MRQFGPVFAAVAAQKCLVNRSVCGFEKHSLRHTGQLLILDTFGPKFAVQGISVISGSFKQVRTVNINKTVQFCLIQTSVRRDSTQRFSSMGIL